MGKRSRPDPKTVTSLKHCRQVCELTQSTVAKAIGVTQATISQVEAGKRPLTESLKRRIQDALNVRFPIDKGVIF